MREITDIHCHIMFGVDDGSDSLEQSIKMLKQEYKQGVRNIILTPHFHLDVCMSKPEKRKARYEQLKDVAEQNFPDLKLYLGNEIMWCNDMVEMLNSGEISTLAGSGYVLVEFYPTETYSVMEKAISFILNGGYTPIVAHCERYECLRSTFKTIEKNNIAHLIDMGAYMQVNVTSVYGRDAKFVDKLIDNDFLHFIASDAHNMDIRGIYWDKCMEHLNKKYKKEYISWLVKENPGKVLTGDYI